MSDQMGMMGGPVSLETETPTIVGPPVAAPAVAAVELERAQPGRSGRRFENRVASKELVRALADEHDLQALLPGARVDEARPR